MNNQPNTYHAAILSTVITLCLSSNAVALGDEPSIPAVSNPKPASTAPAGTQEPAQIKEPSLFEIVDKYREGKTAYDDVLKELGAPRGSASYPDGSKVVGYSDVDLDSYGKPNGGKTGKAAAANAGSITPEVGRIAALGGESLGNRTKRTEVHLIFDQNGILKMKAVSQFSQN